MCVCVFADKFQFYWLHDIIVVGVTPQVIMKGGVENKKIHFDIPTPTLVGVN